MKKINAFLQKHPKIHSTLVVLAGLGIVAGGVAAGYVVYRNTEAVEPDPED